MEQGKFANRLFAIGVVLTVLSLGWWALFYSEVIRITGGGLSNAFSCLYSSSGVCALASAGAQFIGKTPYNPLIFWAGVACLALGLLLSTPSKSKPHAGPQAMASTDGPTGTRNCPFCAESIKAQAVLCRYCGRSVEPVTSATTVETGRAVLSDPGFLDRSKAAGFDSAQSQTVEQPAGEDLDEAWAKFQNLFGFGPDKR